MILNDKGDQGVPVEAEDVDAPPSYDELESRGDSRSSGFASGQKSQSRPGLQGGPSSPRNTVTGTTQSSSLPRQPNAAGWFSWLGESKTKEVKQTIQALIRDVVKEPASPAAVSVLQSCLEACQSRGLSFQSIVSEKFIEGHCPLYWAIVKRSAKESEESEDRVQLLDILLSIPLNATTRSEAYLACLLSSDQLLFQRLRHTPGDHSPSVSAAHELLLGDAPEDNVRSFDREGDHGEFRIVWKIAQFQKRMRAIGGVGTEVVARGRIWSLAFTILPRDTYLAGTHIKAGTWVASVSLLAPSPPTFLDAQVAILEPNAEMPPSTDIPSPSASPKLPPHPSTSPDRPARTSTQPRKNSFVPWSSSYKGSHKPPITLRVKTDAVQLEALPLRSTKQDLRDHVLSQPGIKTLIVPLSNHANGHSLQFDGCSYLNSSGELIVTLDGRLAKPTGGDCIIC